MLFDSLILNGTVIDGTGKPGYIADVGIKGNQIKAVGTLNQATSKRTINASGHIVAPGFIDMHTHSDVTLLDDPHGESKVHQGVTTEVTGNCGYSPFPSSSSGSNVLRKTFGSALISNIGWDWTTLEGWRILMESNGISINVAPQVGNGALRIAVGATEDLPPTKEELESMKKLAAEAVEQGAFSLSTGLTLSPSGFASTDEIVAIAKSIALYDGAFYATHARVRPGWHLKAIEEAVEIGRRANIPVQFSHMAITDRRVYGHGPEMVEIIENARAEGIDITYDIYPYTAAGAGLNQLVPLWVQNGGIQSYMENLRNPSIRQRILEETSQGRDGGLPPLWDTWVISQVSSNRNKGVVGHSLAEIAKARGIEPAETALQLIEEEEDQVSAVVHNRTEDDVRFFMGHAQAMIGSDGFAISPNGLYSTGKPHPRFYGTYPRVLGRYVRKEPSVMSLETAIHKMTGFPAQRLGLRDRGLIAEKLIADLVIFNPLTVIDQATFENPHQYPKGIPHVFVNGSPVVSEGKHTGALPGRVLQRGG